MSQHIHIHLKDSKYASNAQSAKNLAQQALTKVISFSEALYKETEDESGINARYYLNKAIDELSKIR